MPSPDTAAADTSTSDTSAPNTLAITSLVTGLVALLLSWVPFVSLFAVVLAVVAFVSGVRGRRRARTSGGAGARMATAGLLVGVLALVGGAVLLVETIQLLSGA